MEHIMETRNEYKVQGAVTPVGISIFIGCTLIGILATFCQGLIETEKDTWGEMVTSILLTWLPFIFFLIVGLVIADRFRKPSYIITIPDQ